MFNFLKSIVQKPNFIPGEVWQYKTRPGEDSSTLTILKVENIKEIGRIVHISLDNLKIKRPLPHPPEFIDTAGHIPITEQKLLQSVTYRIKDGNNIRVENEGYKIWKDNNESAFTEPVSEIINFIEVGLNQQIENNINKMDDVNGNCKQCGHPFEPHLVIAYDKEDFSKGGEMKCPVEGCKCYNTLSFDIKKE